MHYTSPIADFASNSAGGRDRGYLSVVEWRHSRHAITRLSFSRRPPPQQDFAKDTMNHCNRNKHRKEIQTLSYFTRYLPFALAPEVEVLLLPFIRNYRIVARADARKGRTMPLKDI